MKKATLLVLGVLLFVASLWRAEQPTQNTYNLLKSKRKIASLRLAPKRNVEDYLSRLVAHHPARHIQIYQEVFNP